MRDASEDQPVRADASIVRPASTDLQRTAYLPRDGPRPASRSNQAGIACGGRCPTPMVLTWPMPTALHD